ncbi:MAG: MmgE/PrpD family protein, partial [Dehalococcoidales bacterium]|nr:MmgE/PrpD family protein [Dehalococcoidales bacterium]
MDVVYDLAGMAVKTRYEDLPPKVVEVTKNIIMDSLGVGFAGSGVPGVAPVIDLVKEWGGREESTVMVYGLRTTTPDAAFCNSMLIHAPDFDDTDDRSGTHVFVTALPAALAVAEKTGASGKELITAVAVGADITARLALTTKLFHGWHYSATVGIFGATVAAGKILGLNEEQMVNALGIAYSQASGNRQGRQDGALTKRLQPPFAAKAAVTSALLAQKGITGARNTIEGDWGFYRLYHDYAREYEPGKWAAALRDGLGTRFEVVNVGLKPYPCVRASHAPIDGALDLAAKYDIKPGDVQEVTVFTNERVQETAGRPFVIRANPRVDAQFSIAYTVAVALARRNVALDDFEENIIRTPELVNLAEKVKVVVSPEFSKDKS